MDKLLLKSEHLKILTDIFQSYCPRAEVYAYGSRLNGNAHAGSDLDLAIKFNVEGKYLFELKELISESNIPFLVDIHEYNNLPENFQQEISKNFVVIFSKSS